VNLEAKFAKTKSIDDCNLADFFAGFKSPNQRINSHANSPSKRHDYDRECHNNGIDFSNNTVARSYTRPMVRHRNIYRRSSGIAFFIDWLRKPTLHVTPLKNTQQKPEKIKQQHWPSVDERDFFILEGGTTTEHRSQWHLVHWKEKGELPRFFAKPRLAMKFGVIKVTNLPRKILKGRFCEGAATNLKSDMQVRLLGEYRQGGFVAKEDPWLSTRPLSWYRDGWHSDMIKEYSQTAQQAFLDEMKGILKMPLILWTDLRNPSLDMLPVSEERPAFLLLFYTIEGYDELFTEWVRLPMGKYRLKVNIYSNELKPKEYLYELDFRSWIDWDLKEVPTP
jgi:hypothetical protein